MNLFLLKMQTEERLFIESHYLNAIIEGNRLDVLKSVSEQKALKKI
jgi:hypothetical protein